MAVRDRNRIRGWARGDFLSVSANRRRFPTPNWGKRVEPMVTVPYVEVVKMGGGQLRCVNCGCTRFFETAASSKYRDFSEVCCDECNLRSRYARNGMPIGLAQQEMQKQISEESKTDWERRVLEVLK